VNAPLHNLPSLSTETHWTVITERGPFVAGTKDEKRVRLAMCTVCGLLGEFNDSPAAYQDALATVREHKNEVKRPCFFETIWL
jgi:hypothetical protein